MGGERDLYAVERELRAQGLSRVCGVDEAGRGPLAGPVCAAAVILPEGLVIPGLDDSKRLSEKKREALYDVICREALAWHVGWADVREIEAMNILRAALLAMDRAVKGLRPPPELCLVDGNTVRGIGAPARAVVGGDGKIACIAAASVLAKVSRDRAMRDLDERYPQYGFARHKGYGTRAHYEALDAHGPCPAHRPSFLKKWEGKA